MGTNFYLHVNACPHCKLSAKQLHIGKRSGGWKFLWHGIDEWESPDGKAIHTRARWLEFLRNPANIIRDEYEAVQDPEEFIAMTEAWDRPSAQEVANNAKARAEGAKSSWKKQRPMSHVEYVTKSGSIAQKLGFQHTTSVWQDAEGFDFQNSEFS